MAAFTVTPPAGLAAERVKSTSNNKSTQVESGGIQEGFWPVRTGSCLAITRSRAISLIESAEPD